MVYYGLLRSTTGTLTDPHDYQLTPYPTYFYQRSGTLLTLNLWSLWSTKVDLVAYQLTLENTMTTYSPYAWKITKDHLDEHNGDKVITGPRDALPACVAALNGEASFATNPVPWRCLDDDGEIYYSGLISFMDDDYDGDALFSPLDDFCMPDSGCVSIEYLQKGMDGKSEWSAL